MSAADLLDLDAVALALALRSRKVPCVELMRATLDRIEALNPVFNSIIALRDPEALIAEARERDGEPARGPLHGVPIAVKDLAAAKGLPMTMGSPILEDFVADADSIFVERLRAAGALIIGKTNTPEFGLGSQTYNPVHGPTRNAYDPALTAGGSSGGAAVALALRMLPIADGSDYGGSLRNPAGWNNVYGFRPSIGRVPSDGRDVWQPSMGVNGPMARNPADLALMLSVMAGYDPRDPLSFGDGNAFAAPLESDVRGLRVAWLGDWDGALPCEAGVLAVCEEALKTFEAIGCVVERAAPDFSLDALWRAWVTLRHWHVASALAPIADTPAKRALLKPEAAWEANEGAKLRASDISAASAVRTHWHHALLAFFARYDFLMLPTAQVFPFPVEIHWPAEIAGRRMGTYHEWMKCVVPATMAGGPALAAPAGFNEEGLPIGVQIIGRNRDELGCLRLAWAYDKASGWTEKRRPGVLAVLQTKPASTP
jgi:amidase